MSFVIIHGLHAAIPAYELSRRRILWLAIVAGIIGMLPDLIPIAELLRGYYKGLYAWTHSFHWWQIIAWPWGLHVVIDRLVHDPVKGGWYWWYWPIEVLQWLIAAIYLARITRRRSK